MTQRTFDHQLHHSHTCGDADGFGAAVVSIPPQPHTCQARHAPSRITNWCPCRIGPFFASLTGVYAGLALSSQHWYTKDRARARACVYYYYYWGVTADAHGRRRRSAFRVLIHAAARVIQQIWHPRCGRFLHSRAKRITIRKCGGASCPGWPPRRWCCADGGPTA